MQNLFRDDFRKRRRRLLLPLLRRQVRDVNRQVSLEELCRCARRPPTLVHKNYWEVVNPKRDDRLPAIAVIKSVLQVGDRAGRWSCSSNTPERAQSWSITTVAHPTV